MTLDVAIINAVLMPLKILHTGKLNPGTLVFLVFIRLGKCGGKEINFDQSPTIKSGIYCVKAAFFSFQNLVW